MKLTKFDLGLISGIFAFIFIILLDANWVVELLMSVIIIQLFRLFSSTFDK